MALTPYHFSCERNPNEIKPIVGYLDKRIDKAYSAGRWKMKERGKDMKAIVGIRQQDIGQAVLGRKTNLYEIHLLPPNWQPGQTLACNYPLTTVNSLSRACALADRLRASNIQACDTRPPRVLPATKGLITPIIRAEDGLYPWRNPVRSI